MFASGQGRAQRRIIRAQQPDQPPRQRKRAEISPHGDIGQPKVAATRKAIRAVDSTILVDTCADRLRPKQSVGDVVFCAVDSISARASIWRAVSHRCRFWADGRMLGETIRVLCTANQSAQNTTARRCFRNRKLKPDIARRAVPSMPRASLRA